MVTATNPRALLDELLASGYSIRDAARSLSFSADALLDAADESGDGLGALTQLVEHCAYLRTLDQRMKALDILVQVCEAQTNLVQKRLAATAVLRFDPFSTTPSRRRPPGEVEGQRPSFPRRREATPPSVRREGTEGASAPPTPAKPREPGVNAATPRSAHAGSESIAPVRVAGPTGANGHAVAPPAQTRTPSVVDPVSRAVATASASSAARELNSCPNGAGSGTTPAAPGPAPDAYAIFLESLNSPIGLLDGLRAPLYPPAVAGQPRAPSLRIAPASRSPPRPA